MSGENSKLGLIFLAGPAIIFAALISLLLVFTSGGNSAAACGGGAATVDVNTIPAGAVAGYSGDQLTNAALIMNAAAALNLERKAQVIGVMVAMGESSLRNIGYGDDVNGVTNPDGTLTCSLGLFQQQWCLGSWGTREEVMDPTHAATTFFTRLAAVRDWQNLEPTLAAHKVQRNADPYHYERFFTAADQVVTALAGGSATTGCMSGALAYPLSPGFNITDDFGPRAFVVEGASTWHPAVDLQHYPNNCNDPIYSISDGTVVYIGGYQVSIKAPAGWTVSYLHMKLTTVTVTVGQAVTAGQQIAVTGNEGPSSGCHLDLRINKLGSTDPNISALPDGRSLGGPVASYGYVDPEAFYRLAGMQLCPPSTCQRTE